MLAKILEDMWVEPEVLEALSEEQKRILFLKMREEQVRRWREREDREEREGRDYHSIRSKKASSKHVSWLLGRDGDVSVSIIGEVDEFRSSRLLQSLVNHRLRGDNMNGIQTADLLPGREARQLGFTEDIQLPLADVSDDPASPGGPSSEEDSCGAEDELKDAAEDSSGGDSDSGGGSDNLSAWAPLHRSHFSSHGNQPLKAQLSDAGRDGAQAREMRRCERRPESGSRVAQLRKAFADNPHHTKPAKPAKPAHLQTGSTPPVR
ncbi:SH2 domain-containing protein 4A [Salarias fasciatus]|uniref:SH2 domain-containing protein 4A-like n=1 Tax=Salarias fasciatus TaxID=181472 RepID=A0A672GB50_SALFA|nr:SH2 domain-containing protein 4A-like [Salarias fasciatus]